MLSRLLLYNVARYGSCMLVLTMITFERKDDLYVRQDRMKGLCIADGLQEIVLGTSTAP